MRRGWGKTMRSWGVGLAILAGLLGWQQAAPAQFSTTRQGGTGQMGGSGFTGTTGTTFGGTGTTGTFTGTTGTTGGTGTRTGTTGTGTSAVSTSNPFRPYYYNPLGMPLSSGVSLSTSGTSSTSGTTSSGFIGSTTTGGTTGTSGTKAFGQPLYGTTSTTGTTFGGTGTTGTFGGTTGTFGGTTGTFGGTTGSFGGATGSFGGITGTATTGTVGFTTAGLIRAPQFTTELGPTVTPITGPRPTLQTDLRALLQRSDALPSRDRIQVEMEGSVVVLRGTVASIRERRLAEGMVRMTPGVREVRNELTIGE